jgi:hypothetical protein
LIFAHEETLGVGIRTMHNHLALSRIFGVAAESSFGDAGVVLECRSKV